MNECPYTEFRQERSLGELRAMGFEVEDDISDDEDEHDSDEDYARDRFSEDRELDNGKGATRRVWVRMVWVRADLEDEGIDRLWYTILVGRLDDPLCRAVRADSCCEHDVPAAAAPSSWDECR